MSRNLGVIAPIPKDSFNSSMTYKALSIVTYNGSLYMAKSDVSAGILPTNNTYWMLLISQATAENVVKYTAQSASESEQLRARANIGAAGKAVITTYEQSQNAYIGFEFETIAVWFVCMETGGTLGIYEKLTSEANWETKWEHQEQSTTAYIIMKRSSVFYLTNIISGNSYTVTITPHAYKLEIGLKDCLYGQIIQLG